MANTDAAGDGKDKQILTIYQDLLASEVESFIQDFYATQERIPERAEILHRLSPERYASLRAAQMRHLRKLLDPAEESSCRADALRVGRAHYHHGVLPSWVADSYGLYWRYLLEIVDRPEVSAAERPLLRQLLVNRLLRDLAWQLEGYAESYGAGRDILLRLDQLLVNAGSEDVLIRGLMDFLIQEAGVDGAWLGTPDKSGKIGFSASSGEGVAEYLACISIRVDDTPQGCGPAGKAWRTGEVQVVADWATDPGMGPWREAARISGWHSSAAIPLTGNEGRRDILALLSRERGFFGHPDQRLILDHLAAVLGLALERLRLAKEEATHREALEHLNALYHALMAEGEIVLRAHDEHELLKETCRRLAASRLFCCAWVGCPDQDGTVRYLAAAGRGAQGLEAIRLTVADTPEGQSLAARAWRSGRLQHTNDYLSDPSLQHLHVHFQRYGWRASAAVPIRRQGQMWGMLVAIADRPGVYDTALLNLLARIVRLLDHGLDELDLKASLDAERRRQAWLAHHDPLTALPNRIALAARMEEAMARSRRHERMLGIGILDLDDFKPVNDRYGHAAGDILLRTLAERLKKALRQTDFVARLGGDEFVLVLEDLGSVDDLEAVLLRVQESVETTFALPGGDVVGRGSLGLTLYPIDDGDPDTLLRHADHALYTMKERKGPRTRFWGFYHADEDIQDISKWADASPDIRDPRVLYQPVIDLDSGRVVGVEALVRLAGPDGQTLPATRFLPFLSMETRRTLMRSVFAKALEDLTAWDLAGFPLSISVVFEARLLPTDAYVRKLVDILGASGIAPSRVTLEILGGEDFLSQASAPQLLWDIKATGIRIALHDVGNPCASILRIKDLPIDAIKLDQKFVRGLGRAPDMLHFVQSLLNLARGLQVDFVAEGVDAPEIRDALATLGTPLAQGCTIAYPLADTELLEWLKGHEPTPLQYPKSLPGLYAWHMRFAEAVRVLLTPQISGIVTDMLPTALTHMASFGQHIARMGLNDTPIAYAHRRYGEVLAATIQATGKADFTDLDLASNQLLECIRLICAETGGEAEATPDAKHGPRGTEGPADRPL